MKKSKYSEEQIAFALRQTETGTAGGRGLPEAWDHRADVLPLEAQVWRAWSFRAPPLKAIGGGKQTI